MTDDELRTLGAAIERARTDRGWGKEEAARQAGISSITWKRAEDGKRIQAHKMRMIETTLGWGYGSSSNVARGREPIIDATPPAQRRDRPMFVTDSGDEDAELIEGFQWVGRYATACRQRGADPIFAEYLIRDAIVLADSVARAQLARRSDFGLAARRGDLEVSPEAVAQEAAGEESQDFDESP